MNDIRILISSALNQGKALKDLNESIKAIEKHPSLQKIKLKIDIDQKFTQSINSFISAVGKMKKISDENSKVMQENIIQHKRLDGSIETTTQKILKNGEILTKNKTIHDANKKAMQDESLAAKKLAESVNKMNTADLDSIKILRNKADAITGYNVKSSKGYTATNTRLSKDGQTVVNSSETTNLKKEREETEKLKRAKEDLRKKILELAQVGQLSTKSLQDLARGTNQSKNASDVQKVIDKYNELKKVSSELAANQSRQYQSNKAQMERQQKAAESLLKSQRAAETQVTNLIRRFGTNINSAGLNTLLTQLKNLKTSSANYKSEAARLRHEINQIGASASTAAGHTLTLGNALKTALTRFPIWIFLPNLSPISVMIFE